jgi:hypothetical protein
MRRVVRGCCGALGPIFVGRNQEGRYGARTAFDFASGLLEVAVSVLGGFASRVREHVSWLLLMLQWRRRVARG